MADKFMKLIESYDAQRAGIQTLFGGEGTAVSEAVGRVNPTTRAEGVRLIAETFNGKRPMWHLREALSTSDFPLIFGDTLDRMMLADFKTFPSEWRRFMKTSVVPDFRSVKRFRTSDGDQRLTQVGQGESYPVGDIDEASYSYSVNKYGRRFDLLWEALQNDDLGALRDIPSKMARAARRTEDYFASSLYVANSTLYATNHSVNGTNYSNKLTTALTLTNLEAAYSAMMSYPGDANSDGTTEPIFNTPVFLVVPRKLKLTAEKIVGQINYVDDTETNVLRGMFTIIVDPYIDIIDTTNGATSWYLYADPGDGHAVEVGFLRGHESPQMFMKSPNAVALSGGSSNPANGDFDTDSVGYKVRHVIGGSHANAVGGWRYTLWSDGSS